MEIVATPPLQSRNIAHSRKFVAIDTILEGENENASTQSDYTNDEVSTLN